MGRLQLLFSDEEEQIFNNTIECLSVEFNSTPLLFKQQEQGFSLDPYTRTYINDNGEAKCLTSKQFDLLYFLYSHKGQVFTKEQLYEKVWGYDDVIDGKNLTSFIRKLRIKIEPNPSNPKYIITVWGVGYKFNEEKPQLQFTFM